KVADAEAREAARLEREKVKAAERAADREAKAAQAGEREKNRIRIAEMQAANRLEVEKVKAVEAAERQKVGITERSERERRRAAESAAKEAAQAQRSQQGAGAQKAAAVAGGMQSAGGAMVAAGTSLTATLTVPLAAFAKYALDVGTQYDEAMNMLQVATSATSEQMQLAAQKAIELGADMTLPATSAANAATAMLELGKASMTIEQSMAAARGVLQLAAAANIDEARAAEIAANALNAFNLEASESTRVSDLLAAAANASSAEITDIAAAMQQSSAVFASAKVPIEDLTTMIAMLANKGIKGSDAGTSLKTMLMRLQAPTKEAAGALHQMGVKVFDGEHKLKSFRQIIAEMSPALAKMTDEQKAQTLQTVFGADAMRAATIVFGGGVEAYDRLHAAATKQGAAAEMAAARTKGLGGAWKGLTSQIETLALLVYNQFKGPLEAAVRSVAEAVGQLAERFSAFAQAHPNLVMLAGAFAGLLAAVGPVLVILGGVVMAIGGLVGSVLAVKAGILALGGAAAVLALTAKLVLALAAALAVVAVAAAALYFAWQQNLGGVRDFAYAVIEALKSAFNAGLKFILDLWAKYGESIMRTAAQIWNGIAEVAGPVLAALVSAARENFGIVVDWVRENWPLISKTVEDVMKYVGERVRYWLTAAQGFWQVHGEQIKNIVSAVWTIIKTVVQTGLRNVLDVIKLTLQLIQGDWSGAWETWKGIVARTWRGIFEIVKASLTVFWNLLKSLAGQIGAHASAMLAAGRDLGRAVVDGIVGGIKSGASRVTNAAKEMAIWAITGAKVQLDSHSPSKVFWGIGRDVALGFILGIGSMEAEAQETLNRLVIPKDVQSVSGKGSAKANRARRQADKVNRPGYDLLEKVYQDIDQLAPAGQKTKELEVTAELAGAQYRDLAGHIRTALVEAARFYDGRKAALATGDELNNQLDAAAKKLLEFKYSAKEGASEVERFDLFIAQMRAESPLAAAALDKAADKIAKVRAAWAGVDAEEKARKTKEAAAALSKAVAEMADESGVALRDLSTAADTNLEKFLLKLSRLKDLSLDLSQLNPIHDLALSLKELPAEERLQKLAEALERVMRAARPAGMGDADWQKFIADSARGIDNAAQTDSAGQKQKALDLYNKTLEDLDGRMAEVNGRLSENNRLSEAARVQQEMLRGAYKDLTDEQRQAVVARAAEIDLRKREVEEALKMREKLEELADSITGVFDRALDDLFEQGFKGFFKSVVSGFKQMFQQVVKDFLLSGVNKVVRGMLGLDAGAASGGAASGGGGILGSIGKFFGGLFGGGSSASGGGALNLAGSGGGVAQYAAGGVFGAGSAQKFASNFFGPSLTTGATPSAASTLTQQVANQTFSTAARSGGKTLGEVLKGSASLFSSAAPFAALLPALPMLAVNYGIASWQGALQGNLSGFQAATGSGLLGFIINRHVQRRRDEKARDASMVSSLASLNELLKAVNSDQMMVADAVAQAGQVRQEYVNASQALKDKKTRNIALKDVSRLDAVISNIHAAGVGQKNRLEMVANRKPEFAAGGIVPGALGQPVPLVGHGGEIFINPGQMAGVGAAVMALAGVPGVSGLPFSVPTLSPARDGGAAGGGDIVVRELRVSVDAGGIFVRGGRTRDGRRLIVETIIEEEHEGGLDR
ncbi:MAG TPA: phage tail tape measure protein, partial [Pyrinomonadaceae bacterium]